MTDPLDGLDAIAWSKLKTAYGTAEEIPSVLRTLAQYEADEDTRMDAWAYLQGTLFHQGDVFEATAYAIPFVARLALEEHLPDSDAFVTWLRQVLAAPRKHGNEEAILTAMKAAVPVLLMTSGADTRFLLRELRTALGDDAPSELAAEVDAFVPSSAADFVAIALEGRATEAQRAAALARVNGSDETAVDIAAAYMLSRCTSDPSALPERVHDLATPGRMVMLRNDPSVMYSALGDVELPPPPLATPKDTPLEDAKVIFAGNDLLLVEHPTRGRFTIRVRATGLAKGDVVRIGAFTAVLGNVARVAEIRGVRHVFDERGMPVA